ncbi:ATP-binding cassette domain-containing protein [Pusillimonas sp. CC-YST705]|uniref:ATP-binding cassette domain-containing protein n=1 Tax=Mesopusillimonas faecipullorum TaxID=2755040 RepID=A0ABS8CCV7_9BURK|nr:ATP-binding cassette domain-containing protein [Mesopusillimonas faecipullorum]MCB5363860.1 ATP-binding cassette domain-containing protein [Mesopusillimonas faecipullorum]
MIDLDIQLTLSDARRRFELSARLSTEARFAVLYGPSGSGKTTTLQAIAGLQQPTAGRICIDGQTLFDHAGNINVPGRQRRVGYLFQQYALFPHLSVRANVEFGLTSWYKRRPSHEQRDRVEALLESFGLSAMENSLPRSLSGGQQQRVALARALACEPRILLLDEPFAALNPMLKDSLRAELAATCQQWGIPVLMITHDPEDVVQLAQVAFVFEAGRIVREIDVENGRMKEHLAQSLGQSPAPIDPRRQKLKAWLG